VKLKTGQFAPVSSLDNVNNLRLRARVVGQCQFKVTGWGCHVYLCHGTSVCWQFQNIKTGLESGPVTTYLTTTIVHSYNLLIHDVKSVHSLADVVLRYMGAYLCHSTRRTLYVIKFIY